MCLVFTWMGRRWHTNCQLSPSCLFLGYVMRHARVGDQLQTHRNGDCSGRNFGRSSIGCGRRSFAHTIQSSTRMPTKNCAPTPRVRSKYQFDRLIASLQNASNQTSNWNCIAMTSVWCVGIGHEFTYARHACIWCVCTVLWHNGNFQLLWICGNRSLPSFERPDAWILLRSSKTNWFSFPNNSRN